jgi:hypothetical protein
MLRAASALLFALFVTWSGRSHGQTFDASLRAFGGLELDDRVLEGPAYGYGADAFVHVAGPISVGAYAEWREAFVFSETAQTCDVGDCDRNELLLGGLVKGSMPLKSDVYAWLAVGAGYRRHEWVTANGFASDNGSIVSHGIDLLKLELGFDFRLNRFLQVGPYFDWAFGCFYDRHRSYENGSELELENTCSTGPPFVSMGVGFRAGFYVK